MFFQLVKQAFVIQKVYSTFALGELELFKNNAHLALAKSFSTRCKATRTIRYNFFFNFIFADCGAAAVYNILLALDMMQNTTYEQIVTTVNVRKRDYATLDIFDYFYSRMHAGTVHVDLIQAVQQLTSGKVVAQFFPVLPACTKSIAQVVEQLMQRGVVALATGSMRSCFHHQMIFGAQNNMLYLTNPVEKVTKEYFESYVSAESHLTIDVNDVLRFKKFEQDFSKFDVAPWNKYNIPAQVKSMFDSEHPTDVKIPWGGTCGITCFAVKGTDAELAIQQFEGFQSESLEQLCATFCKNNNMKGDQDVASVMELCEALALQKETSPQEMVIKLPNYVVQSNFGKCLAKAQVNAKLEALSAILQDHASGIAAKHNVTVEQALQRLHSKLSFFLYYNNLTVEQVQQMLADDAQSWQHRTDTISIQQGQEFTAQHATIKRASFPYEWGNQPNSHVTWNAIHEETNQVVGYITMQGTYIFDIAVHPAFQYCGIGKKLVQHVCHLHDGVSLDVRNTNIPAIECYKRLGFVPIAVHFPGYYDWHGGVSMQYWKK